MDISFDAVSSSPVKNSVNQITWTHTSTGSNLGFVVFIHSRNNSGAPSTVTDGNIGGVALTSNAGTTIGNETRVENWYCAAQPTGAQTVTINLSGTSNNVFITGTGLSFTNVDSTVKDAGNVTTGSDGSPNLSTTTVTDKAWVVGGMTHLANATGTANSGQTDRRNDTVGGSPDVVAVTTKGPITPAGSANVGWSIGANDWAFVNIALKPAAGGPQPKINQVKINLQAINRMNY